jgi:hypothetical protein
MNRDREAHRRQPKERSRRHPGAADDSARAAGAEERGRSPGKMQKTYGIREDEARRQIRELQSRY